MPTGTITPGKIRKPPRAPLTDVEKERIVELYVAGEHSLRDIAEEFDSNPSSVSRVIHDAGVPMRAPGPSDIQKRNQKRRMQLRREQAEALASYEENIKAAVPKPRVRAADRQIAGDNPLAAMARAALHQEARASVALDGETQTIGDRIQTEAEDNERDFDGIVEQAMGEDTTTTKWTPQIDEDPHDFSARLAEVEEMVADMGSFSTVTATGHLRWVRKGETFFPEEPAELKLQFDKEPADPADYLPPLPDPERRLQRQHEAEKLRWESGVAFGYEQATNHVTALVNQLLTDPKEFAVSNVWTKTALERVLQLLGQGEHFYRARRNPKPWNDAKNWET